MARQVVLTISTQQFTHQQFTRVIFRRRFSGLTGRLLAVQQQRPRFRFVDMTLRVVGAQQVFEFAFRPRENFFRRKPYREAGFVEHDDFERDILQ